MCVDGSVGGGCATLSPSRPGHTHTTNHVHAHIHPPAWAITTGLNSTSEATRTPKQWYVVCLPTLPYPTLPTGIGDHHRVEIDVGTTDVEEPGHFVQGGDEHGVGSLLSGSVGGWVGCLGWCEHAR